MSELAGEDYIRQLTQEVKYWCEWVVHEEWLLNRCENEETKILLKNRLKSGYRNLEAVETGLKAVKAAFLAAQEDINDYHAERSNMEVCTDAMGDSA